MDPTWSWNLKTISWRYPCTNIEGYHSPVFKARYWLDWAPFPGLVAPSSWTFRFILFLINITIFIFPINQDCHNSRETILNQWSWQGPEAVECGLILYRGLFSVWSISSTVVYPGVVHFEYRSPTCVVHCEYCSPILVWSTSSQLSSSSSVWSTWGTGVVYFGVLHRGIILVWVVLSICGLLQCGLILVQLWSMCGCTVVYLWPIT